MNHNKLDKLVYIMIEFTEDFPLKNGYCLAYHNSHFIFYLRTSMNGIISSFIPYAWWNTTPESNLKFSWTSNPSAVTYAADERNQKASEHEGLSKHIWWLVFSWGTWKTVKKMLSTRRVDELSKIMNSFENSKRNDRFQKLSLTPYRHSKRYFDSFPLKD